MSWQDAFDQLRERTHNPLVCLSLEVFGDDVDQLLRAIGEGRIYKAPWVARIRGPHPRFKLDREFQNGSKDYSHANSKGSRGVQRIYWLNNGVYEVAEKISWGRTRRYFIRVAAGTITEIPESEVLQWVRNECSASASLTPPASGSPGHSTTSPASASASPPAKTPP